MERIESRDDLKSNTIDLFDVSHRQEHPRIEISQYPSWLTYVTQSEIDFLEIIVSCDYNQIKQGLPKHFEIQRQFMILDRLVAFWGLNFAGYHKYNVASMHYRQTKKIEIASFYNVQKHITVENDVISNAAITWYNN